MNFEAGHEKSREFAFLLCTANELPLPAWLAQAMLARRPGRKGRAHSPRWKTGIAKVHAMRWSVACYSLRLMRASISEWDAMTPGEQFGTQFDAPGEALYRGRYPRTEQGAFQMAQELLKGAPAQGTARSVEESYRKVAAAIAAGDARLYLAALDDIHS